MIMIMLLIKKIIAQWLWLVFLVVILHDFDLPLYRTLVQEGIAVTMVVTQTPLGGTTVATTLQ